MTPARILVVEDDRVVSRDIQQQLIRIGHVVAGTTARGEDVVALARETQATMVLMDIQLDGAIDGIDAAHLVREQVQIPVIYLTAFADGATLERASTTEPYGYLLKPFEDTQLRTAIELALHTHAVTKQMREAEVLRKTTERVDLALRGSNIGIWDLTLPDGTMDSAFFSSMNLYDYGPPQTFRDVHAHWHPEEQKRILDEMNAYLQGRIDKYEIVFRMFREDGALRWRMARGIAVRDNTGKATRFVGSSIDITDQIMLDEALRVSEQRFRNQFELSAAGFVHTDFENNAILRMNKAFCDMLGYTAEELSGRAGMEVIHPDDRAGTAERFKALARGETTGYVTQFRIRRKDGVQLWVRITVSVGRDSPESRPYAIGIVEDISDAKRLELELREAKEIAEAGNRAKDEFLANVSHEIRTPMNAILGMTELVLDSPLNANQRQSLRAAKSAAENLLGIIDELLDFSKIEAGKLELDPAEFLLRSVVEDAIRSLGIRAHRKGLELSYHVADAVPDVLVGDARRLRQVLINLVGNAVKFTAQGEVIVRVEMSDDGRVRFVVRDTGIGIPREKQAVIFDAFEQEDNSTTRKYGGTGLGLTIAARLAAMMDGEISVESTLGVGSTFTFVANFMRPSRAQIEEGVRATPLEALEILIASSDPFDRGLHAWLVGAGMRVLLVSDTAAAMDALWHGVSSQRPYKILLLDAAMGLDFVTRVRERAELATTRIVLLSNDREGERDIRVNAHLVKPVARDELLETLRDVNRHTDDDDDVIVPTGENLSTRPLHILVAEDNPFNSLLLQQLLTSRGHTVRIAPNGREALALSDDPTIDLLLLDLHMPEIDGFAVIAAIRARSGARHLPVIALTARSRAEDRARCLEAGMDDFLSKPIQAHALWDAISRAMTNARLIDPAVLLAACGGVPEVLASIAPALRTQLPEDLGRVQRALAAGDPRELREAAHRVCGMLAAFSSLAGSLASELEDRAANGALDAALVDRLVALAPRLIREVDAVTINDLRMK